MKKLFVSKSFMKKIALVLVVIILFQVVVAKPVRADIGGTLLSPIVNLVVFLADGAISILQNSLSNAGDPFIYLEMKEQSSSLFWGIIGVVVGVILIAVAVVATVWTGGGFLAVIAPLAGYIGGAGLLGGLAGGFCIAFYEEIDSVVAMVFGNSFVYSNIFITPEALLKDQIALFNVNFFSDVEAIGSDTTHALATAVRGIIGGVYRTVRDISIVAMLIIIVYIAIRMLISLSPREKSRYKEGFMNCMVGLVLIITMHYIMAISTSVISMITSGIVADNLIYECDPSECDTEEERKAKTEQIANDPDEREKYIVGGMLEISGAELYDVIVEDGQVKEGFSKVQIKDTSNKIIGVSASNFLELSRYKAQQIYNVDGDDKQTNWGYIGWAFAYIMLVVLTIAFVWMYAKRFLYMAALTMCAPIVGVMYPINKADGSRAQTLNMWVKEYMGNLIIQPFHLLLYSILIGGAIALSLNNPIYVIMALLGMTFIEKLLKDLVGIQDTRAGSLGSALKDTNRAIKTATNATKNAARSAGRMLDKGVNAGLGAADKLGKHGRGQDGKEEDGKQKPPKEIGKPNDMLGTEDAKKDAEKDPFELDDEKKNKDADPYLVDKSFEKTDDFGLDDDNNLGIEGDLDSKPESLYDSDDEWAEQLREQGLSDEEIDEAMRIRNGSTEPTAEQLARGINEDGIEMVDDALYMAGASNPEVPTLGATEDGMEMVDEALYMSGTSKENAVAIGGGNEDEIELDDAEIAEAMRRNPGLSESEVIGGKAQLPKPPEFLDVETMSSINEARMEELKRDGGTEIETSSGLKGVVSKDGGVIAADFTKIGQKKGGTPKSADAKANQIPMQNAVGQNANVNNTTRMSSGAPKLSVVNPGGTSSSAKGGSYSSGGASSKATSSGNVSTAAYKGNSSSQSGLNRSEAPKLEVVPQKNGSQSQAPQVSAPVQQVSAPEPQVTPQVTAPEPQVTSQASAPEPQVAPQVTAPEPQVTPQASAPESQVAPQVSVSAEQPKDTQENNSSGKGEAIASGVVKAASIAGSVAGTAGKVTGNLFEGVMNMAVDGMTGNPGQVVNDAWGAVTGSSAAISDAGGKAVSTRGKGQLSDDAQYLMREGNSEERAQYVEAFCQRAREKGVVIDTREDKRSVARALKDIGDKNDKTINSLILEAIKHKRAGRTKEDYEKYIDSKGVSSSVKNALLRLYEDARK